MTTGEWIRLAVSLVTFAALLSFMRSIERRVVFLERSRMDSLRLMLKHVRLTTVRLGATEQTARIDRLLDEWADEDST